MIEDARPRPLPVLWICGPPGVGKTAVSWRIFTDLGRTRTVAYVDIDQLGICYPEPAGDPGRHRLKARNLGALAASVADAGVTCLVVSGVIDPVRGPHAEDIGQVDLTLARLRAAPEVLHQRLTTRNGHEYEEFEAVLRYADELDPSRFADVIIDTTTLTVGEVADRVRQEAGGWPTSVALTAKRDSTVAPGSVRREPVAGGRVLWLIGATVRANRRSGGSSFGRRSDPGRVPPSSISSRSDSSWPPQETLRGGTGGSRASSHRCGRPTGRPAHATWWSSGRATMPPRCTSTGTPSQPAT